VTSLSAKVSCAVEYTHRRNMSVSATIVVAYCIKHAIQAIKQEYFLLIACNATDSNWEAGILPLS